jgi:GntR family transcriptional regulator/MocR family aminotransferase
MDVDADGLVVDAARARAPRARAAYVTPSHQFPLGGTLSASRRYALLEWAHEARAWIIEDDYDSEFRYATHPLPALQGLDADGRVLYVGTFSKTLVPALRLGYLVVPRALAPIARAARALMDRNAPTITQTVLASLIDDGSYARHVRRMRLAYAERQRVLVEACSEHLAGILRVQPADAGMHLMGWLEPGWSEPRVLRVARAAQVELSSLRRVSMRPPPREGVMLGYAAFTPAALRRAARHLSEALHADRHRR